VITLLFVCLAYSSNLKMEAVLSSETLVKVYQTTRHHITEDSIFMLLLQEPQISQGYLLPDYVSPHSIQENNGNKKVKISLLQAVEAHRVARGQGSHIT
jgi:hypothetical protein